MKPEAIGSWSVDTRRAVGLLGLTSLVSALPFVLCSPPMRPAPHRANVIAVAAVIPRAFVPPDGRALPDVSSPDAQAADTSDSGAPDCLALRCVALTFDDGPGADTARLLGMLATANVRATFFLIGEEAANYPDMVRAELAQGEEVGNHSWNHPQLTHLDDAQVSAQETRTAAELSSIDGQTPTLFRPPYGDVNARVSEVLGE